MPQVVDKTGFKPKAIVKRLLTSLPERSRVVLEARFGLGNNPEKVTLEAIGKRWGITRERVRQIENHALNQLKKSPAFGEAHAAFNELERIIDSLGGIVCEDDLLAFITKEPSMQNYIYFLLVLGDPFKYRKEDDEVERCWYVDPGLAGKVEDALKRLYEGLSDEDLIPEGEMIDRFLKELQEINDRHRNDEVLRRWLSISKKIGKNPLGEWGHSASPNVKTKGVRDYAYLAVKKHGSPLHFREVAQLIEKMFNRAAHVATTHNELIKDNRFVLVGRGMYALKEWGYASGVVRDVIRNILRENGPLTKDQIIEKVLKERHVKPGTVSVNLQNQKYFKRGKDGRYVLLK
ncbi:MAG TPA: sigma factor-like helix-turn-helix DNA-binding protein [Candidatus Paceibacterota bacterium]|nr:sigma factor-like helix-turn-helix DNA-binding protein [Candidatus Paceibacterota bacterium]